MKKLFVIQSLLLVGGSLIIGLFQPWRAAASFGAGAALVLANIILLAWATQRLMQKKRLALSTAVIVFKYAILGIILYQLLNSSWLAPLWFCAGIGTLMLAAIGAATLESEGETTWPLP